MKTTRIADGLAAAHAKGVVHRKSQLPATFFTFELFFRFALRCCVFTVWTLHRADVRHLLFQNFNQGCYELYILVVAGV